MHCKRTKIIIGTQKSVYWNSLVGKLEKFSLVRTMNIPPQQGFDCNSEACFPIGIDDLPAIAFEDCIVGAMPFANSTAVAAPFACVPTINNFKSNVFIEASAFEQLPEFIKWNPHNCSIEPFSFSGKSFEIFNCNVGIKPQSYFSYLLDNLTKPVLDEVTFSSFEFGEFFSCFGTAFIGKGLQQSPAQHYLFSFYPDVFSEIGLFEDFPFGGKNGNCKAFAVNVDSENILFLKRFGFGFREMSNNLPVGSQTICLALPSIRNERGISLEVPVFFDWNSDSVSGIHSEFDKETGFCAEGLAVSGNIKLDSQAIDFGGFLFPSISDERASYLDIERGFFFAC